MKTAILSLILVSALPFIAGCPPINGTPPTTQQSVQSIALQGETFASAARIVADARDAGLATQAELDAAKPVVDAYLIARATAEAQIKAGADPTTASNLIAQANAAWLKALPFFTTIQARKATTPPTK